MTIRGLLLALTELSRAATSNGDATHLLERLCVAADGVIQTDGVGVMVTEEDGTNRFLHATTDVVAPLERLQEKLRTGPCRDAADLSEAIVAGDLGRHSHWPGYSDLARELDINAAVAIPLICRGRTWAVLDLYRRRPGDWRTEELEAGRMLAEVAVAYLAVSADREAARHAQSALAHQTMHDPLTGLPNRTLLFDRLNHALASAARRHTTVAVFFIDLDGFKAVNDSLGHAAGDQVLVETADRLSAVLRAEDTLGRLSGDEFVWICEHLPAAGSADLPAAVLAVGARIREAFAGPIDVKGTAVRLSASVGVALADGAMTAEQLLAAADEAMYVEKHSINAPLVIADYPVA